MYAGSARRLAATAVAALTLGALSLGTLTAAPAMAGTGSTARTSATRAARATAYPFAHSSPQAIDPWGSYDRQCTSFASWWLAHHGVAISGIGSVTGPLGTQELGDATQWDAAAKAAGFVVQSSPVVGAVAQWHAGETSTWSVPGGMSWETAGPAGHVGIVRKVLPGGLAIIDDYNGLNALAFREYVGKAPRYIRF